MGSVVPPQRTRERIRPLRYLRLMLFFSGITLGVGWWEILLKWVAGERFVGRGRAKRLRRYARRYRQLAIRLGGVMIKMGQFIGSRADILPKDILDEMAGLLDEVPPEPLEKMLPVFREELGAAPDTLFLSFSGTVMASASLGQVYTAETTDGRRVAVKVQRPGIERIVATDLRAFEIVAGWLMAWKVISRRADVPALMREFSATLWEELDYLHEAANAERFGELFADDPHIYIPRVHHDLTTRRVITLDDVTAIKVTETDRLDAAGIDRAFVARTLIDAYLKMIFEFGFFHADPHPGNLFVYPLPENTDPAFLARQAGRPGKPFYIALIDFGMTGEITSRTQEGLHEFLLGMATRDPKRMLRAYQALDILLPGADVEAIQAMDADFMEMIYGRSIPDLMQIKEEEARAMAVKYVDLIHEMPFQVPQNFIYLGRAIAILSGISIQLDPGYNPWVSIGAYAAKFAGATGRGVTGGVVLEGAKAIGRKLLALPGQLGNTLANPAAGRAPVKMEMDPLLASDIRRIGRSVRRLESTVMAMGLGIIGAIFYTGDMAVAGWVCFGVGAGLLISSWISRVRPPGHRRPK